MCRIPRPAWSGERFLPRDFGIGGGDVVHFRYRLDCGRIQGTFPVPPTAIEEGRD